MLFTDPVVVSWALVTTCVLGFLRVSWITSSNALSETLSNKEPAVFFVAEQPSQAYPRTMVHTHHPLHA